MMNGLFSIFDPSSSFLLPLNWLSLCVFPLILIQQFWVLPSPILVLFKLIVNTMKKEFSILLKTQKINILLFISLFLIIIFNNTVGLLSFTFTATSHLSITLSLALPLWLSFIIFSLINNMSSFLAHLVPSGTPPALMPFMVIIELVSNTIRPITLSVRLAANMIAGHLLLTLLGNQTVKSAMVLFPLVIISQTLLMLLECAVACIQAYVFSVLTTLYASEA